MVGEYGPWDNLKPSVSPLGDPLKFPHTSPSAEQTGFQELMDDYEKRKKEGARVRELQDELLQEMMPRRATFDREMTMRIRQEFDIYVRQEYTPEMKTIRRFIQHNPGRYEI